MPPGTLDVQALAHAYRRLVLWFGVQLLLSCGSMRFADNPRGAAGLLSFLVSLGMLATVGALIYYGYRTAAALGSSVAVLWAAAMLVPCLNIVTLLALSSRATHVCRENGIPVGLLGPEV